MSVEWSRFQDDEESTNQRYVEVSRRSGGGIYLILRPLQGDEKEISFHLNAQTSHVLAATIEAMASDRSSK